MLAFLLTRLGFFCILSLIPAGAMEHRRSWTAFTHCFPCRSYSLKKQVSATNVTGALFYVTPFLIASNTLIEHT